MICGRPPKLSEADVQRLVNMRRYGWTADKLAQYFGVARSTVLRYLRGECRQRKVA